MLADLASFAPVAAPNWSGSIPPVRSVGPDIATTALNLTEPAVDISRTLSSSNWRVLRISPVPCTSIGKFRKVVKSYGDADIQIHVPTAEHEWMTATVTFCDNRVTMNFVNGLRDSPQFRETKIDMVPYEDLAVVLEIPWAAQTRIGYESLYQQLARFGPVERFTLERLPALNAVCIFHDSRHAVAATQTSVYVAGSHLQGRLTQTSRIASPPSLHNRLPYSIAPIGQSMSPSGSFGSIGSSHSTGSTSSYASSGTAITTRSTSSVTSNSPPLISPSPSPISDAPASGRDTVPDHAVDYHHSPPHMQSSWSTNCSEAWRQCDNRNVAPFQLWKPNSQGTTARTASIPSPAAAGSFSTSKNGGNYVDVAEIYAGRETRTTIMLRNIPNKVDQQGLKKFLDDTNRGTYDFLYLRIDFANKCNVGYAFVSFTRPEHVARFVQARRGMRWTQCSSEKVIDVSFANFQGRDFLINKFRNSPVMAHDPAYRPKLYYTEGHPLAGEEKPFPLPDSFQS